MGYLPARLCGCTDVGGSLRTTVALDIYICLFVTAQQSPRTCHPERPPVAAKGQALFQMERKVLYTDKGLLTLLQEGHGQRSRQNIRHGDLHLQGLSVSETFFGVNALTFLS